MKCAVKNCSNHLHQGSFTGKFCSPCYSFIIDKNTDGTIFTSEVLKDLTKNKERYKEKL